MDRLTVGSLFSGIGGFDLGLERAGYEISWQVENNEWCRRILRHHWPSVMQYGDIKAIEWEFVEPVHVLCGGFPCQDVSEAGRRRGLAGDRSGLWTEFARCLRVLRPRIVIVENVTGLLERGFGTVLRDLAEMGFDAEWSVLSCCAFGAPHTRERVFIVAYPTSHGSLQRRRFQFPQDCKAQGHLRTWPNEPEPVRVADGISKRMDRLRGLGNSVCPQIAEAIGRMIQPTAQPGEGVK